jgi:cytochrome c oxidase subunit 1/cytochrome c oxidase subunit I+III
MTISVFSTIQVFAWLATLWRGRPVLTTSLLFALGFIATFVVGGLSGVVTAAVPFDWQVHDTYFVVAHLHYVLIGANLFPVMAALYYWFPKMSGRLLDERLGRLSFWTMFLGFNVGFFPMHVSGLLGMRRRVYTYGVEDGLAGLNLMTTAGALVLGAGLALSLWNVLRSRRSGRVAGPNPWNADTLEWAIASPPPAYAVRHIPRVATRHPLWDDFDESADPAGERVLDRGRQTLSTTWRHAEPAAVAQMPEDSIAPLVVAALVGAVFTALLLKVAWVAALFAALCAAASAAWLWPRSASAEARA